MMQWGFLLLLAIPPVTQSAWNNRADQTDFSFIEAFQFNPDSIEDAKQWLKQYNEVGHTVFSNTLNAWWNYEVDLTVGNRKEHIRTRGEHVDFDKKASESAQHFNWRNFEHKDAATFREFTSISGLGTSALSKKDHNEHDYLVAEMSRIFSVSKVCNRPGYDPKQCFEAMPDLTDIVGSSTDWDELVWAWQGWRNATEVVSTMYPRYIDIQNEAAARNNVSDWGAVLRSSYDDADGETDMEAIWNEIRPLYIQLHAYVRRKLMGRYRNNYFPQTGHIPDHITGNMVSQTGWESLESLTRPYPNKPGVDVTDELVRQGYTPYKMFRLTEEFFTSLGFSPMTDDFWRKSELTKPYDRDFVCYPSAWDFYNKRDFRIKQCTDVNMYWLYFAHHEMGHIAYDQQYKDQPIKFKDSPNPGFHEAIGEIMALSFSTPEHLQKIGLLRGYNNDQEFQLNFLMRQALLEVAFLPFGLLVDKWRYGVYNGTTPKEEYNSKWWKLRCQYQGVSPPVERTNKDFDPGALYFIPANVPFTRYFVATILQFQFHKSMCEASGHVGPLHTCDNYQSKEAGKLLRDMLKLGSSIDWPDALEMVTGERKLSTKPLLEFFSPLLEWLQEQNAGHPTGWDENCPCGTVLNEPMKK